MITIKTQLLLLCLAVGCLVGGGCSPHSARSWSSSCGHYAANNQTEAEAFQKSLAAWLSTNGFVAVPRPDGVWFCAHYAGETDTWYKGTYRNSPPFWLLVQTVKEDEKTTFHFSQCGQVRGSHNYVENCWALSEEFTQTFTKWLEETGGGSSP